jgi:4-amino-4-deoxy-L-arabinose transferase-like glycosyltransferase
LHTGDAAEYQRITTNLLAGRGFSSAAPGDSLWHPTSWRTPGYPLFLAAHQVVFGEARAPLAARVTQAGLDAASALLVIALGCELGFSASVARLAGLLYAVHPLACLQVVPLGTEALVTLLLAASMLLAYRAVGSPGVVRGLAIGLLFGVLLMIRPTAQFFAPILCVFLLAPWEWRSAAARGGAHRGARLATAAAFGLALVLVLVPWTVRNYRVHGAFVPFSTLGGVVLYEGVGAIRTGDWWSMPGLHSIPAEDWARWRELGEVAGEKHMRTRALGVIREHPIDYVKSTGAKLVRFWLQVSAGYGRLSWRSWAAGALQACVLFLAIVAFIRHRGAWVWKGLLLWLLVLYHSALYSLTVAEVRYSYALLPYVLLPAALTLASSRTRAGGARPGTMP